MEAMFLKRGSAITFLVCAVLTVTLGILYPKWRRNAKIRTLKQKYGCKDPSKYPHKDRVWGSDMVEARRRAMKEGRFFKLYDTQFELYGKTFEEIWRGKPLINTIEPANAQKVAALAHEDYGKDPERLMAQAPFLGPSILSHHGSVWKRARAMVKPIFARAELSDIDHFALYTDRFMELLPNDGSMVDIQPLVRRLFLDVSMDFLFGRSLGFLQPEIPAEATEFLEAFKKAQEWAVKRRDAGWWDFRRYRYNEDKEFKGAYTTVHRYVDEQVARALRETVNDKPAPEDPPVRRRYVLLDEMAKEIRDPIQLRYHVLAVFLPGWDGAGRATSNMIFQLARHPDIWTKLRQKALDVGDAPLTFEKLKSLAEFRYTFYETVRTIGPVGRIWRVAIRDTVLPVGGGPDQKSPVFVARGTAVVSGTWAMCHDKAIWGDDADEFKPDRWIGRKTLWEFVPFWGGPRNCPAQQQVMTHAMYLLFRLTQRFERIENCDPVFEYIQNMSPSVESRNGVKVAFKNA
ncbi:related to n-alkane-inducible cytochrome P450 [Phialocephala subalpina]|uniref:Related to n-alkane-inducible cytochrome P450 n=1 Tax=Phialocephala subalpina TaxID=576137 RepID=A0A1L7WIY3_9HELO|nr:related to n-alkane-inducible cytochrome P450 [Phialocephala subalpina]